MTPRIAMVLAAGRGRRMRPLTDQTPKPLLPLGGRTLLDHALDRLVAAGVRNAVVNTHWQADRLAEHLAKRRPPPEVIVLRERELLDTGGAVRAAVDQGDLPREPCYVVNGDSLWLDGPRPALQRIADAFDPDRLDAVLLVHRAIQVHSEIGRGDFQLDRWGEIRRAGEREVVPYVYAGVQVISPALLDDAPSGAFSMNLLWDRAMARGRLRGVVHDGLWFHLSTPADLAEAETNLQPRALWDGR